MELKKTLFGAAVALTALAAPAFAGGGNHTTCEKKVGGFFKNHIEKAEEYISCRGKRTAEVKSEALKICIDGKPYTVPKAAASKVCEANINAPGLNNRN